MMFIIYDKVFERDFKSLYDSKYIFYEISGTFTVSNIILGGKREGVKRIFRIQKRVIRLISGVSSRTSCRQLFKELNILTLASLYIFEITCFIRKYCQSLEQNYQFHQHNTRRKLDIHVKTQKTELYKKSVINMGTRVYNNLPKSLK